jgi:hypothetical protein
VILNPKTTLIPQPGDDLQASEQKAWPPEAPTARYSLTILWMCTSPRRIDGKIMFRPLSPMRKIVITTILLCSLCRFSSSGQAQTLKRGHLNPTAGPALFRRPVVDFLALDLRATSNGAQVRCFTARKQYKYLTIFGFACSLQWCEVEIFDHSKPVQIKCTVCKCCSAPADD